MCDGAWLGDICLGFSVFGDFLLGLLGAWAGSFSWDWMRWNDWLEDTAVVVLLAGQSRPLLPSRFF